MHAEAKSVRFLLELEALMGQFTNFFDQSTCSIPCTLVWDRGLSLVRILGNKRTALTGIVLGGKVPQIKMLQTHQNGFEERGQWSGF